MTGIPILDTILDLIMQYRLGIAMMGLAVIAVGLLARPMPWPPWSSAASSSSCCPLWPPPSLARRSQ